MKHFAMYRIHTERKNEEQVIDECRNMLASFSIWYGVGFYQGEQEESMMIEACLEETLHNAALVRCLAESIKHLNAQDAVLFTVSPLQKEEI